MTLKKLLIQNFQAHSKLKIEFDDRITTIVGSSDVGKSAILRALRWVCRNHPQGESFIKEGTTGTTVKLKIDDDVITRKRGKGENSYLLNGKTFKAFGNNVPDTIADKLNLNDINFQNQHDAPFWFSLSAPEVSRQLNSIVDLGIIDSSLSAIGKKVRNLQLKTQFTKERLKTARDDKKEMNWIIEADSDYKIVEKYDEECLKVRHDVLDLANMIEVSNEHTALRLRAISQTKDLKSVGKLGQECLKLAKDRSALSAQIKYVNQQQKLLDVGFPDFTKLDDLYQDCYVANANKDNLKIDIDNVKIYSTNLEARKITETITEDRLHEATDGRCPVCGKEME